MLDVVIESDLPNRAHRGKVRDTYDLGDQLLIVATDRVSAFDVVLDGGVPRKGEVLTRLSAWWFDRIKEVMPNHFIALITEENAHLVPFELPAKYHGRSMVVRKAKRLDAECIARGYLSGSGWRSTSAAKASAASRCNPACVSPSLRRSSSPRPRKPRWGTTSQSPTNSSRWSARMPRTP
jgi:phosphoribosylaminoimidazole-succinocarboxamide synthase